MKPIERTVVQPPERVIRLPIPPGYHPPGSCWRQQMPDDLDRVGYVEEEYILTGRANVYLWPDDCSRPQIRVADAPYCTRMLLRRPKDPARFSGVVCTENFNNAARIDMSKVGWTICRNVLIDQGDAWVGYDVQRVGFRTLRELDPARYGAWPLDFPNPLPPEERGPLGWHILREEFAKRGIVGALEVPDDFEKGLMFDMSYQLAALLRRGGPGDPLEGFPVKTVCGAAIADFNLYVAGFEPWLRRPDGGPMFDGFLKLMSGAGGELSREADMWQYNDPRSMVYSEVPFIKIETAGDMRSIMPHPSMACGRRMKDRDEPGKKVCWYELAGVAVTYTDRRDWDARPRTEDLEQLGMPVPAPWPPCPYVPYAGIRLVEGAYANLRRWMLECITPPHMETPIWITGKYPNVDFVLDEFGNHIGGVRSPYVDVPAATYADDGTVTMLPAHTMNELYGSKEGYVRKVEASAARMAAERWILPDAERQIVEQARQLMW